ncbi:hypothetical protein GJ699_02630 [Duganella sp. FT80W]|uniref:Gp5/Type VI secretion system Vgr protein OB-fold domain-containing protein n=1 Tax=Duganella guangzhouensis TaxID=2666084 RepID=A0A6I2KWT1_9BURK|nr:phage baseplate assembly protein V [Duganella guangzhouensis]MRW88874.1 hypothetical protein [Duganella guangzhouensis]
MMHLQNQFRMAAELAGQGGARPRFGTVTGYDGFSCATVRLEPEGVDTGWLPIQALQVGAGWGIVAAPSIGDVAKIEFQEGDSSAGMITGFFNHDGARSPEVPAGEFWIVRKDGGFFKFLNNGNVVIKAANVQITVDGQVGIDGNASVSGNMSVGSGATGSFTTPMGDTVTVQDGIVTNIF